MNRRPQNEAAGLWLISRKDSSQKLLLKGLIYLLKWSEDGKWIYAMNSDNTPPEILKVNSITGSTKIIFTSPFGKMQYSDVDITSNGNIIVCATRESNSDVK